MLFLWCFCPRKSRRKYEWDFQGREKEETQRRTGRPWPLRISHFLVSWVDVPRPTSIAQFPTQLILQSLVHCFWGELKMWYFLNGDMTFLPEKNQEKGNPCWPWIVCFSCEKITETHALRWAAAAVISVWWQYYTECKIIKSTWNDALTLLAFQFSLCLLTEWIWYTDPKLILSQVKCILFTWILIYSWPHKQWHECTEFGFPDKWFLIEHNFIGQGFSFQNK